MAKSPTDRTLKALYEAKRLDPRVNKITVEASDESPDQVIVRAHLAGGGVVRGVGAKTHVAVKQVMIGLGWKDNIPF